MPSERSQPPRLISPAQPNWRGEPHYSVRGVWQAECRLFLGDAAGALSQTRANLQTCRSQHWGDDIRRCNALLARLLAVDQPTTAAEHLQEARAFAEKSGEVELQLRCFQSACELSRHLGGLPQSIAEGEAGILLADTCGFGKYSIDIRISLAEAYLAASNFPKALHFCGLAQLCLGEIELARQRLTAALALREKLGHGRIAETRRALAELDGTHRAAKQAASGGRLNS